MQFQKEQFTSSIRSKKVYTLLPAPSLFQLLLKTCLVQITYNKCVLPFLKFPWMQLFKISPELF